MTRYMRGMTNGGMIQSRYGDPLTMDAIAAAVPSVFATEAHESRSERFAYIPTSTVLEGLHREGFEPFYARQSATRIKGKESFTKHMVRLRHRSRTDTVSTGPRLWRDGAAHEVILVNAHDGTAAYQMISGVFRFVCSNGLFVGDSFGEVKVRHTGDAVGQVIEGAYTVLEDAPRIMEGVAEMRGTDLTQHERTAFAEAVHALRFGEPENAPVPAARMLRARRPEDAGHDLWSTFNVAQENVIRGGLSGWVRGADNRPRRKTTREVAGIDQNRALNRALWTLAEALGQHKAAAAA